jgi:acyl carrier protein
MQQSEEIRSFVKEQISYLKNREIAPDDIPDDRPLAVEEEGHAVASLELDSLDQVELALLIETEFNIGTPEDLDFQQFHTVNDIVDFVVAALEAGQPKQ